MSHFQYVRAPSGFLLVWLSTSEPRSAGGKVQLTVGLRLVASMVAASPTGGGDEEQWSAARAA